MKDLLFAPQLQTHTERRNAALAAFAAAATPSQVLSAVAGTAGQDDAATP